MSTDEKPDVKPEGAKHSITIRLKDGDELAIKIKSTTKMKKLYDAIAQNKGMTPGSFKLTYDGAVVQPEDTPQSLEFEEEEQLDVQMAQVGGGRTL
ncbi:hypothetical protein JCM16303_004611 [Sporobolomyces ruberrimus]